jgi:hypothetical protein
VKTLDQPAFNRDRLKAEKLIDSKVLEQLIRVQAAILYDARRREGGSSSMGLEIAADGRVAPVDLRSIDDWQALGAVALALPHASGCPLTVTQPHHPHLILVERGAQHLFTASESGVDSVVHNIIARGTNMAAKKPAAAPAKPAGKAAPKAAAPAKSAAKPAKKGK